MWPLLFLASIMPIWREADIDKPLNIWQFIHANATRQKKHLPVEEALNRAEQAGYLKRRGILTRSR